MSQEGLPTAVVVFFVGILFVAVAMVALIVTKIL
jgi:hypothetical protein